MPVNIDFAGEIDLSCTKVNAVNRLSGCLDASFRLSREEAAPRAAARSAWGRARARPLGLPGRDWPAGLAGGAGGSKRTDAALQMGGVSSARAQSAEERSDQPPSVSAVLLRGRERSLISGETIIEPITETSKFSTILNNAGHKAALG